MYVYLGCFYRNLLVCADGVGVGGDVDVGVDLGGDNFVFDGVVFGVANKVAPLLAAARTRSNLVRGRKRNNPFGGFVDSAGGGEFGGGAGAGDGV